MKKLIICLLTLLMANTVIFATSYRGSVNFGIGGDVSGEEGVFAYVPLNLSTSHGLQLNRHFFAGAGLNLFYLEYLEDENSYYHTNIILSPFLNFRYDVDITRKWSPFIDLRVGYNIKTSGFERGYKSKLSPLFISPSIGVRFKLSSKCALNVSLSYIPYSYKSKYQRYEYNWIDEGEGPMWTGTEVTRSYKRNLSNVFFNFGVEF